MKIGFVAEPYEEHNASGMGYVVMEFMKNLPLEEGDSLTVYSSKPVSRDFVKTPFENVLVPKNFFKKLWYFFRLQDEIDVLLFIAPLLPLIIPKRIKAVQICQELGSQKTPVSGIRERSIAFLRDQILMPRSLARASAIVAASYATKTDIHTYYAVPDEKVIVVYDGYQDLSIYERHAPVVDPSLKPFFYFAGKVKGRKNVHGIVSGFVRFKERVKSDVKLLIAGDYGGEYFQKMKKEIDEHALSNDIIFAGYTSGAQHYAYYKNALALVFPSFNEGFGMPPVEAMSLGLPVITSNLSSMAEVVADAGLLVDPYDVDDISRAMEKVYIDPALREELIKKGYMRAKDFSWTKASGEVMASLREITAK
ncbi:MAG: glycosyltransferase family 1 protein [Patescibacteria group bacterium]